MVAPLNIWVNVALLTTNTVIPGCDLQPQAGVLVDDLTTRLTAVWNNLWAPLVAQYPDAQILSGFRTVVSGVSQHETGEAIDVIVAGDAARLFAVAQWARDALAYDTCILCWSETVSPGWLHLSFTQQSRRRLVQTKDYADALQDGLYLITPYSDTEKAVATTALTTELSTLTDFVTTQQSRAATFADASTSYHPRCDDLYSIVAEALHAGLTTELVPPPPQIVLAQTYLGGRGITAHLLRFVSGQSLKHFGFQNETGVPDASGTVSGLEVYQVLDDDGNLAWTDLTPSLQGQSVSVDDSTPAPTVVGVAATQSPIII